MYDGKASIVGRIVARHLNLDIIERKVTLILGGPEKTGFEAHRVVVNAVTHDRSDHPRSAVCPALVTLPYAKAH